MSKIAEKLISKGTPVPDRSRAFGTILVEQGFLSVDDVERVQRFARASNMRFGEAAMHLKLITQNDIDTALAFQFNYPILPCGGEGGVSADVVAAYLPQSPSLEPMRALRSQINLRWLDAASRKTIAITSPARHEGRSWIAANLATMFAQLGERTLLIDADMRQPSQHRLFNIDNSVGLSALLTGRAGREIARRIHPQLRLFVVPAGILPPNPQELLERPVFNVILDHFAEQFSVVVLDTPAASESADAQILASRAGAAIMLARRNFSRSDLLTATMHNFTETGVNVIGSVLTDY
jgi:protein-tyrosine kinase